MKEDQQMKDRLDGEFHDQETFVREHHVLLNYITDILAFAAKKNSVELSKIFITEVQKRRLECLVSKIKTDQDVHNIKNRVTWILMKYQEQSTLLDNLIGDFVEPIMRFMQIHTKDCCKANNYTLSWEVGQLYELLFNLCNVRGYKTVVKFFPHEVADMEPVVELLHFQ